LLYYFYISGGPIRGENRILHRNAFAWRAAGQAG
jgi:hypothetical protein